MSWQALIERKCMALARTPETVADLKLALQNLRESKDKLSRQDLITKLKQLSEDTNRIFLSIGEQFEHTSAEFKQLREEKTRFDAEMRALTNEVKEIQIRTAASIPPQSFAFKKTQRTCVSFNQVSLVKAGLALSFSALIANRCFDGQQQYKIALVALLYFACVFRSNIANQTQRLFSPPNKIPAAQHAVQQPKP